jgi:hypothetical protein
MTTWPAFRSGAGMTDDERAITEAFLGSLKLLDVAEEGLAPGHQLELLYTIAGLCRDTKAATAGGADVDAMLLHRLADATERLPNLGPRRADLLRSLLPHGNKKSGRASARCGGKSVHRTR